MIETMKKSRSFASLRMTTRAALGMTLLVLVGSCDSTKPKPAVDIVPGSPSGNGQSGVVGATLANPIRVKAVDEDGGGVAGVTITWNVSVGGGSMPGTASVTGDDGTAVSPGWKLGNLAGTNAVTASAAGIEKTLTFLATGAAGAPATITIQAGANQVTAAGSPVAIAPSVRVLDQFFNPVSGVTVTFAVTGGGGSVTGPTAGTNLNGIATAGGWTLGPASGTNTLSASVGEAAPATFTATATAPPTQLVINTQPSGAVNGEIFDVQPVISVRDAGNGVVTSSTALVTATIASGTGTLTGTTTVAALNGIATFQNLAINGTSAVTLQFTSSPLTAATSASFTPGPPPPLNLTIDRVHLTQGAQTYAGTVPIVAGRPAFARVFVKANVTNTSLPGVRLQTFVNGTPFKTYNITAPGSPTKLIDDADIAKSWNVLIPANEVVAGMSVLAEVDVAGAVGESSEVDNSYPVSGTPLALDVRQVNTMKVTFVPVTQPGIVAGNVTEANKNDVVEFARRVYPIDTFDIQLHAPYAHNIAVSSSGYDNSWQSLLQAIHAMHTTEGVQDRYYYGVVKPGYTSGPTGLGYLGFPSAIGVDFTTNVGPQTTWYSMTMAHEWGHNFNRQHIACGGPANPDPNVPFDPLKTIGSNGFDNHPTQGVFIRKATDMRDLMSYCSPYWTSDYTYKAVLDYRETHPGPVMKPSENVLLVWGRVGPDGVVLEPAYEIQAPPSLPTESGPYTLQALDDAGRTMFSVSFVGAEMDHVSGVRSFAYAIPLPASGARPAALRLMNGSRELLRRSRALGTTSGGANTTRVAPPTRLQQLSATRARLEWDAATYPGAMVRDPATGQVLAFMTGGSGEIAVARDVDVVFSTGVGSVKQRVQIVK